MKMKPFGMSALALLGALLLGTGQVQASETLNTILGGGAGGVGGTMIGKEVGGDTGALVGAALGARPVVRPRPIGATRTKLRSAAPSVPWAGQPSARASVAVRAS